MYQGVYIQDTGGVGADDNNDDEVFENKVKDEAKQDEAEVISIKVWLHDSHEDIFIKFIVLSLEPPR